MRYTFQKVAAVFQGMVVAFVIPFVFGLPMNSRDGIAGLGVQLAAMLPGLGVGIYMWRRAHRFQTKNFVWYRAQFPHLVSHNSVRCKECNGSHIRVRGLMQHSYTREHFCAHCGTTLYYSPE